MSEPNPQTPVDAMPQPSPPPSRRHSRTVVVIVTVAALLVGVGATTAGFLLYDRLTEAEYTFRVTVFVRHDATAAEKDAIKAALETIDTVDGVHFETREQAYRNFKQLYEDSPDLVDSVRPDTLPESFQFQTRGRDFDCTVFDRVKDLPGVDDYRVTRLPKDRRTPGRLIGCT